MLERRVIDMTIDEAIALVKIERECVTRADVCDRKCEKCDLVQDSGKLIDMYEQLAEWLEDYKRIKMLIPIEQALKNEYNKAIDDFKKMLTIEKIKEYAESDGFINLNNCSLMIFDIAEKLKVGGKNG